MTLQLDIAKLAGPGRRALPLEAEVVRPLNEADLALLATKDAGSTAPPLKKIGDRHHALARLLASGVSEGEAALITGYDISRVSILKNSPAFQELVALYRKEVDTQFSTTLEHMAGLSKDAVVELRDRLEENPERFSVNELTKIISEMYDRTKNDEPDFTHLPDVIQLVAPEAAQAVGASEEEEDGSSGPAPS